MKKINLEEIISQEFGTRTIEVLNSAFRKDNDPRTLLERWKEIIKKACKQTLELAAENAKYTGGGTHKVGHHLESEPIVINKDSILNTINQIE